MTKKANIDDRSDSEREIAHAKLLEDALAQPGVKEAMQVYGGWRERDRVLDSYRSATKKHSRTVTTNSSRAI